MKRYRLPLIGWVMALCMRGPLGAQQSPQDTLGQLDQSFVCPENLPNDHARDTALRDFLEAIRAGAGSMTVAQMIEFRMFLLKKHNCAKTLEQIHANAQKQPKASN